MTQTPKRKCTPVQILPVSTTSYTILSLNVNGLRSRIKVPDFLDELCKYDIVCLQETKTDESDHEFLINTFGKVGFNLSLKSRKKLAAHRSGGIGIAFKRKLNEQVRIINNKCPNIQWLLINDMDSVSSGELFVGNVYLPPENSKYSNKEDFDDLIQDIISNCRDRSVCICGDFNAHTSSLEDYTILTNTSPDPNLDVDISESFYDHEYIAISGFELKRSNTDKQSVNNFGRQLIELCKCLSLYIVNGRAGVDRYQCKPTTKLGTVIDYFIMSA